MGHKVNAVGMRIGINRGWESNWFATKKNYASLLHEDIKIRKWLEPRLKDAVVSHITINRTKTDKGYNVLVNAYVARPGVVLGQDSTKINELKKTLQSLVKSGNADLKILDVKNPDLDATLLGKWIAGEIENRQSFRSTQKKALQRARKAGAKGVRTICGGRLGGAEIARAEGYKDGDIPLHTIRADIDFAHVEAATAYGRIGVKVWICRSTEMDGDKEEKSEGGSKNAPTKAR